MKNSKHLIGILLLITVLGAFFRLWDLGNIPNGFYVDEAVTGVNAYSILQTGKDEYGKQFPLAMRFFGTYTPPLYTYLTIIPIFLSGLNIFSVRIISAISGILLIPLTFYFIKSLGLSKSYYLPIIGALIIAISPWSIFFSRAGYEVHLAFFLYCLGVFFLWIGLKRPMMFMFAGVFLALSANTYHAERILSTVTLGIFTLLFFKTLRKKEYWVGILAGLALYVILMVPQIYLSFTPAGFERGKDVVITRNVSTDSAFWYPILLTKEFLSQYFAYFSPRNLFYESDSDPQRSIPGISGFYSWMVIPYLIGLYLLLRDRKKSNPEKFLLSLLIVTPIPSALAGDPFSAPRSLPLLLPLTSVIAFGIEKILESRYKKPAYLVMALLFIISLIYLFRSYAIYFPNERAKIWGYGYEQLANEISSRPNEKFIIDTARLQPIYSLIAFYQKIPPDEIQNFVGPKIRDNYYWETSWDPYYKLRNFETRAVDFRIDLCDEKILVGDELTISGKHVTEYGLVKVFEIKSPINDILLIGYRTNPKISCADKI